MHQPDPQREPASEHGHVPVMLPEVIELLAPCPGGTILDATIGRGGHAAAIIPRLGPAGRYVGLDLDPDNIAYTEERLASPAREAEVTLHLHHANFQDARDILEKMNVGRVQGVLADLGVASAQIDEPRRGFSFRDSDEDAPLDMRLDPGKTTTAADLVNHLPQRALADLIYAGGEEPLSRRIARKIVETRRRRPIRTTRELSELVRQAYGPRARHSRMHPATRTFMALRIAVNGELEALERLLEDLPHLLDKGGRGVFISFHSLEDRRVKQAMQRYASAGQAQRLTRKPMTPAETERNANPRSRSAKLRAIQWLR